MNFYRESITKMIEEKSSLVDIGGDLGIGKGNRRKHQNDWAISLLRGKQYIFVDKVGNYDPDVIGDVQKLPFKDASQEAILCNQVLQYVEDPQLAMREIYRVLKPGGYAFIAVPFLQYYTAYEGYYPKDYWRFTIDGIRLLCKDFSYVEIAQGRGALETWLRLSPLGRSDLLVAIANRIDRKRRTGTTTSTYMAFLIK